MNSRILKSTLFFLLVTGYFLLITSVEAATLYFYPQNVSLVPGEEVLIDVRINTRETINAVELEGALSGVAATLRGIDNAGSDLSIFVEKPSVKGRSEFRLVGGAPVGLVGERILARLAVRGELPGKSVLSFIPDKTRVLLADGTGNSAAIEVMSATINVAPRSKDYLIISSESHPDQNQWYAADKANLRFSFDPAMSYSYVITHDPLENPDDQADMPDGRAQWDGGIKLDDLPEGVSYFAVKKVGSTSVSRYRLMNDVSAPVWMEIGHSEGTPETEGRPFLTFLAQDTGSGVEYYEVRINGGDPVTVSSPYPLPDEYTILSVRAYDRAGNYVEEFIPGPRKEYSLWVWAAILFVLLVWVSGIIDVKRS